MFSYNSASRVPKNAERIRTLARTQHSPKGEMKKRGEEGDCSIQRCQRAANSCWPHICCALRPGLFGDETQPWLAGGKPVIGAPALCRLWGSEPNSALQLGGFPPLFPWFPCKHENQAPCKSIWAPSPHASVLHHADSSTLSSSGWCPSPIASSGRHALFC